MLKSIYIQTYRLCIGLWIHDTDFCTKFINSFYLKVFSLFQNKAELLAVVMKCAFFCFVFAYVWGLHAGVLPSWKLLFTPFPPVHTLYSAWHRTLNPPWWRLCHCKDIVGFPAFLSRRWTSCLVNLGIPAALCKCGYSKRPIKVSWTNECKLPLFMLCKDWSSFSVVVLFYINFSCSFDFYSNNLQNLWHIL